MEPNSGPSFPAAVITTIPCSTALFTASSILEFVLLTPKLMLIISTLSEIACSIALIIKSDETSSPSSETLYAIMFDFGAIPFTCPSAEIIFGEYGRERDLENGDFSDSIILVERGSDVEGETVYFSDKENNSANVGAKAVIVFNNEQGVFLGELVHEFVQSGYQPSIPTVSISREDGLAIKESLANQTIGILHVFYNPSFIVVFTNTPGATKSGLI